MPYVKNPITYPSGKVSEETAKINTNFSILADAFYNSDPENSPIYRACYVGITAPLNPKVGQIWVDTSVAPPVIKVYNGTNWLEVKPASVDEPSTPYIGQFWFDTTVSPPVLKIYDGTNWQVVNVPYEGNTAPTTPYIGQLWLDTSGNPPILKIYDGTNWQSNVSNADKLDGQDGSYYLNRANHTGTQPPSTISPQGHGSGLDADTVDTFHASQTPEPNVIPVAASSGKLDVNWIPSMFNSVQVITPSKNTIYQETAPCLIMVVSQDLRGLEISPDGTTWYGKFGQEHYAHTTEGGTITFFVPKNWYWRYSSENTTTNQSLASFYWLKFILNY
jgi:hypothetical protein